MLPIENCNNVIDVLKNICTGGLKDEIKLPLWAYNYFYDYYDHHNTLYSKNCEKSNCFLSKNSIFYFKGYKLIINECNNTEMIFNNTVKIDISKFMHDEYSDSNLCKKIDNDYLAEQIRIINLQTPGKNKINYILIISVATITSAITFFLFRTFLKLF